MVNEDFAVSMAMELHECGHVILVMDPSVSREWIEGCRNHFEKTYKRLYDAIPKIESMNREEGFLTLSYSKPKTEEAV